MEEKHKSNARVFKAFCDEKRLAVLEMLQDGEKCACHLLDKLNIGQSTLSHHMKILCDSGIVKSRKEGKWTFYSINEDGVEIAEVLLREITKIKQTKEKIIMKKKVAFICVHNSCRSQMAEALGKLYGSEVFESYSAGTEVKPEINQDAVKVIKDLYNIDMNESQKSKLLKDIPPVDIVIKMGCNVVCPYLPGKHIEDWGLDDPTGKSEEEFIKTAKNIESKIKDLVKRITDNEL